METKILDRAECEILRALQLDARLSSQQLAERVGLSATPCWRRVRDLESRGVIRSYTVILDAERLGLHTCVLAHVSLARHGETERRSFEAAMQASENVIECYRTTGAADYLVKVVARDVKDYNDFLNSVVFRLPFVANIHSNVVLEEIKGRAPLPVARAAGQ